MAERDDYFGDVVYDAWRSGYNPDAVERDQVEDYRDEGMDSFEAGEAECRRQQRIIDRSRPRERGRG